MQIKTTLADLIGLRTMIETTKIETHRDAVAAVDVYGTLDAAIGAAKVQTLSGADAALVFELIDRVAPKNGEESEAVARLKKRLGEAVDVVVEIPESRADWLRGKLREVGGFSNRAGQLAIVLRIFKAVGID